MEPAEAKAFVDNLYKDVYAHWDKKINRGAFMTQLRNGTLPLPCLRRFLKTGGFFPSRWSPSTPFRTTSICRFLSRTTICLPAFSDKIAEELIAPKPPGHILILLETANALGLSKEELFEQPASAPGRAISDYCRRVFQDGSIIELWGAHAYEETLAHWSKQWGTALVEPLRHEQTPVDLFHRTRRSRPRAA